MWETTYPPSANAVWHRGRNGPGYHSIFPEDGDCDATRLTSREVQRPSGKQTPAFYLVLMIGFLLVAGQEHVTHLMSSPGAGETLSSDY
jgi:hypothetical protein